MNNNQNQAGPGKTEINKNTNVSKEEKKNRIIGSIVLAVIVLAIIFFTGKKNESLLSKVEGCNPGDLFSQTTGEPCFPENIEPCMEGEEFNKETGEPCPMVVNDETIKDDKLLSTTGPTNGVPSSYDGALLEYKDKGILFDASCGAIPKVLEVPVGTRILVANNSIEKSLELKVGNRNEDLSPLHFMLSSKFDAVGEYSVSCGGAVAATVNVK